MKTINIAVETSVEQGYPITVCPEMQVRSAGECDSSSVRIVRRAIARARAAGQPVNLRVWTHSPETGTTHRLVRLPGNRR